MKSKRLGRMAAKRIKPEEYSTEVYRRLAKEIYSSYERDETPEPAMILNDFEGNDLSSASEVFYNLEIYDGDEATVNDLLYTISLERLDLKIKNENNLAALSELYKERERIKNEKTWEE